MTTDNPLVTVVASPAVITARVDMLQAAAFAVGAAVAVRIGASESIPSEVVAVSAFQESGIGLPPGYDITVAVPDTADPVASAGEPVTVSESAEIPVGLAVPLTAVRQGSSGNTYVVLAPVSGADPSAPVTVDVTVVGQSDGYASLADNPDLSVGVRVVVSGG